MNWRDYIESDEKVMVGRPVIKGTRITIEFLLSLMAQGWSEEKILKNYPTLTKNALTALHAFVFECFKDGLLYQPLDKAV